MNENMKNIETVSDLGKRIRAIADIGLLYTADNFDKERYEELKSIAENLMAEEFSVSSEKVKGFFDNCVDYPTPKVDIRALVMNTENKILMVQEKADGNWSLPGGWADIGNTPSEVAILEVLEETGIKVSSKYLAAVFDKRKHDHPPQPYYVYKMVFYRELISQNDNNLKPALDVLDAGWFAIDNLPALSTDRILAPQIEAVFQNIMNKNFITLFD